MFSADHRPSILWSAKRPFTVSQNYNTLLATEVPWFGKEASVRMLGFLTMDDAATSRVGTQEISSRPRWTFSYWSFCCCMVLFLAKDARFLGPKCQSRYGAQDSHRFGKAISLTLQKQARVLNSVPIMEERNGFDLITPHKRRR